MNNTIILKKGKEILTSNEYKNFEKGDTIFGNDSEPEELKRWSIEQEDEAKEALKKYNCKYEFASLQKAYYITEYALEYCECAEDGEFIQGSDFDLAEEKMEGQL